ncbi:MAG: alpha/beta fold hydrolase, partial [Tepidiformaceae bacterium]
PAILAERLFVVTFDCRGIGASERRDEPFLLQDEVADVEAVMTAAGLDQAAVYGRSRGGMLAQQFALDHPERVSALLLSGTSHRGPGAVASTERVNSAMAITPGMTLEQIFATQDEAMAAPGWRERDPQAFAACLATDLESPPRRLAVERQRGAIAEWSSIQRLPEITVPTLVLCGEDDGMVPPENSRQIATLIPGARLALIPECGHLPMLEKPEAVAQLVFQHLGV